MIAAVLAYEEKHGTPMRVTQVLRLADAEGASPSAALVLTRGKAGGRDGWAVDLSDDNARVFVGDADTRVALQQYGRRRVRAFVTGPYAPW